MPGPHVGKTTKWICLLWKLLTVTVKTAMRWTPVQSRGGGYFLRARASRLKARREHQPKIHYLQSIIADLVREEYTFGRGDECDYCFQTQNAGVKNSYYLSISKTHFRIYRVR